MPRRQTVVDQDLGWRAIRRTVRDAHGEYVTVGVRGGETSRGEPITNIALAMIHEFGVTFQHPGGTPYVMIGNRAAFLHKGDTRATGVTQPHQITIPERSFIRSGFDKNVRKYIEIMRAGARKMAVNQTTARRVLGLLGEIAVADVVSLINAGIPPPNAPSTIRAKGSSKPLIDTGQLKQSVKPKLGRE